MNSEIVISILLFVYSAIGAENGCKFSIINETAIKPLFLQNKEELAFFYPDKYNEINMSKGDKMKLSCTDKKFIKFHTSNLIITCVKDNIVRTNNNKEMKFKTLECKDFPSSVIRKTNGKCYKNNTLIEIGFEVEKKFFKVITTCFDTNEEKVLYSWYNHSMLHRGHMSRIPRPFFVHDDLYSFNVTKVYNTHHQREVLTKTLKSKSLAYKYVKNDNAHFLSRGHLTPKADFVFGSEQASTFHYINAAPQWQIFNGGNWEQVENLARKILVEDKTLDYGINTGTYGVATLPDKDNVEREIYLHTDKNNNNLLPVPKFYWKIIYNKRKKMGIALVGINNPHLKKIPKDYVLCRSEGRMCKDFMSKIKNSTNIKKGYIYCCRMRQFLKITEYENVFK